MGVTAAVLAVDGGNSKTDVALLAADGSLLGHARGAGSNHQTVGADAARDTVAGLIESVRARAGLAGVGPVADVAALCLAGADLPADVERITRWATEFGWANQSIVDTDLVALLHTRPHQGNAVVVVCGGGINAMGLRADGATVRFPALGQLTGDWGGGTQLALEVLFAASRAEDGRGPATALADAVCALWGSDSVRAAAEGVHSGKIPFDRLHELPPLIFAATRTEDAVSIALVDRLADEVVAMAAACLRRLDLLAAPSSPVAVSLGGGVLVSNSDLLLPAVRRRLAAFAPAVEVGMVTVPPLVGAAVLGFGPDADPAVLDRARAEVAAGVAAHVSAAVRRPRRVG
ncbi:MAG TPA: BadF/BadG/BcrA/BcrD ATPase family protein [Pseudonocardiaceae bacterium]|nr:BadF/BadG/BcrA/BcrD ATPase family protein [Pseudonocardiaceae bacterium]